MTELLLAESVRQQDWGYRRDHSGGTSDVVPSFEQALAFPAGRRRRPLWRRSVHHQLQSRGLAQVLGCVR